MQLHLALRMFDIFLNECKLYYGRGLLSAQACALLEGTVLHVGVCSMSPHIVLEKHYKSNTYFKIICLVSYRRVVYFLVTPNTRPT